MKINRTTSIVKGYHTQTLKIPTIHTMGNDISKSLMIFYYYKFALIYDDSFLSRNTFLNIRNSF